MDTAVQIDDRAPDFELADGRGEPHRLRDYRGQPVVLVFYPADFHPVCTEEHACFADARERIDLLEAQILGISVDGRYSHAAFAKATGIRYPLLTDAHPKGDVGRRYGVYDDTTGMHRRWTFVVDPEGRISFIQRNEQSEVPEIDEVLAAVLEAL